MGFLGRQSIPLSFGVMGIIAKYAPGGQDQYDGTVEEFLIEVFEVYRGTISLDSLRQEHSAKIRYMTSVSDYFPLFLEESDSLRSLTDFILEGVRGLILSCSNNEHGAPVLSVEFPLFGCGPVQLESGSMVRDDDSSLTSPWSIAVRDDILDNESYDQVWIKRLHAGLNSEDRARLTYVWGDLEQESASVFFGWCWRNWVRTHFDWNRALEMEILTRLDEFESVLETRREREFVHHLSGFFEHNDATSFSSEQLQAFLNEALMDNAHKT